MRSRLVWRSVPILGLMALFAFAFVPPRAAVWGQERGGNDISDRVEPTVVEVGRLKFLSASGDIGGLVRHPDGTGRIWNYHPENRQLALFDPGLGVQLWHATVPSNVELVGAYEPLIVGGGSLLLFSTPDKVVAFDGAAGNYRWTFVNNDPTRPFEIAPVNAVGDRVLVFRVKFDEVRGPITLELRALDAASGAVVWQIDDEKAEGWPQVWRKFVSHTTIDAEGNYRTHLRDARTGEIKYTCDFLPDNVRDNHILTARFRTGTNRSRYLLPTADGGLAEATFEFPAELQMPERRLIHVPSVDANIITVLWTGPTNPKFARHTFAVTEKGTTAVCTPVNFKPNLQIMEARLVFGGRVLVLIYRDGNRQIGVAGVDLQTNRQTFDFYPTHLQSVAPEPDQWPMFGIRFTLGDAGKYVALHIDIQEPHVTTMRLIDPMSGAVSQPKVTTGSRPPMNLAGGEFGWIENDDLVVCTAGRNGNLTAEPAQGERATMAQVVRYAQGFLMKQQQRDGSFHGRTLVHIQGQAYPVTDNAQADLGTTALAGIALTMAASDEFDEFGLRRRGAMRRAVRWIVKQQNADGIFKAGYSNFVDHLLATEFLIRALPEQPENTTLAHRQAVMKALTATTNARHFRGGFTTNFDLPASFRIPQAPNLNGQQIARELRRQDQGTPITIYLAHRVFKSASNHRVLKGLVGDQLQRNVRWVLDAIGQNPQMVSEPENFLAILAGLGADFAPNQRPGVDTVTTLLEELPRAITAGERGRIAGGWWLIAPALPEFVGEFGGRHNEDRLAAMKRWLYSSRYPEGNHDGPIGRVQATALAAMTAAALDGRD